jgi:hypothetical protein
MQGKRLLWATSDAALRIAVIETISRFSTPSSAAAAATPPGQEHSSKEDLRKLLARGQDFS